MMLKRILELYILGFSLTSSVLRFVEGFRPNDGLNDIGFTHQSITLKAIDKVAADYISSQNLVETSGTFPDFLIREYFELDSDSYESYKRRAQEFADALSVMYQVHNQDPDYTVNSERINEAHTIIQDTRFPMGRILSSDTLSDTEVTVLVEQIGKCLMILQSFYSNTNWVEMNGGVPYTDFGSLAKLTKMPIASSESETCDSCDDSFEALKLGSCNNNLLVSDHLTSGYLSGQRHSPKPDAEPGATKGKCSHGGNNDPGRTTPAKGGINKETTDWRLSPHAHLHYNTSDAAIQATVAFFMDSTHGILNDVAQAVVLKLLGLERKVTPSLGFAVDVSGSMADDIASVKESLRGRVNVARESEIKPGKYVLSTFNDPESLTTVTSTTDPDEMIALIDALTVHGGGDCPEYAMSGVLAALSLSEPGSKVFLFTDADAKDKKDLETVENDAKAKKISINALLTDDCTRFGKREAPFLPWLRFKRDLATFQRLAESTGGTVHSISSSDLGTVLSQLLEEDFASSTAIVDYFVQTLSEVHTMSVVVDSEVSSLGLIIKGPLSLPEATLSDPSGTIQTFSTDTETRHLSVDKMTMTIQNPTPGTWTLSRLVVRQWAVNVTVSSAIDIDTQLIEADDAGIYYVYNRNPVIGKNYTVAVVVYNLNSSSTSFSLSILDDEGTVVLSNPIDLDFGASKIVGYTSIVTPPKNFYVQLSGTDQNGFQFKRTTGTLITPVGVDLFVHPTSGSLDIGTPHNITYELSNKGSATQTYTVSISDDKGRVLSPTSQHQTIDAGNDTTGIFQMSSTVELELITYTVSVRTFGSLTILQSTTYTTMFAGAYCSAFMTSQKCGEANTGSSNCSLFSWSATAAHSFDVSTFNVTNNVTVSIDGSDRTRLLISGDCCVTNFTVNGSPATGSGCQSSLSVIGSESQTVPVEDVSDQKNSDDTSSTGANVVVIVGALVGAVVLIGGTAGAAVALWKQMPEKAVTDNYCHNKHFDNVSRPRFDPGVLDFTSEMSMIPSRAPEATEPQQSVGSISIHELE